MTHPFLALTDSDREEMLATVGVLTVDELFRDIPASMRLDRALDLEPALSEQELVAHLSELAARNVDSTKELSFLGGGIYDHYVPAESASPDTRIVVDVRGRPRRGRIVQKPIYRKES